MAAGRALTIDIKTTDAQTLAALKRIQKELKDTGTTAQHTSKQGLSLGSALGGLAIGAGLSTAIGEFEEAQTTLRKTEAVIKSTGNAAGVSAEQQAKMVDSFSKLAAVDDEVVAGGANILRTFTQVKSDAFEPALGAALDLSAALGTDLQSATLQVGKALNDPTKGVTALTRAGVSFTAQQKEQIKAMQEAGDIAGAQKLILAELEKQFGGQAEAAATDSAKMKVAFSNAAESLGGALAPALSATASVAEKASAAFQGLPQPLQQATLAGGALAIVGPKIAEGWSSAAESAKAAKTALAGSVSDFGAVKSGAAGAAAGILSYNAAYSALESLTSSNTDLAGLAKDLELAGKGASDLSPLFQSAGGSSADFADKITLLAGAFEQSGADRWRGILEGGAQGWSQLSEAVGEGELRQAKQDIGDLDTALATFASSSPEAAKKVFGDLTNAMIEQGATVEQISAVFPKYRDEMDRAAKGGKDASKSGKELTASLVDVEKAAEGAREAVKSYYDELTEGISTDIAAEAQIDRFSETLTTNGNQWDINTEAGRANTSALIEVKDAAIAAGIEVLKQGGSAQEASDKISGYVTRLNESARAAGMSEAEIAFMNETMGLTPSQIRTVISTNAKQATSEVNELGQTVTSLPDGHIIVTADTSQADGALDALGRKIDALGATLAANLGAIVSGAGKGKSGGPSSDKGGSSGGPGASDHGPAYDKNGAPSAPPAPPPPAPRSDGWVQQPNGRWYHPRKPGEANYGDGYTDYGPGPRDKTGDYMPGLPTPRVKPGSNVPGLPSPGAKSIEINVYGVNDPAATAEMIYRRAGWELTHLNGAA